ncbi:MAG: Pyridoxine/pyridoxamine 5'-phosphate oxidase [Flavobacteriales bacterium]|nr:Pyridoxine/pyridoxamine 5'-phosphate oxidase [Flavobacteriales bacterium]
MEDLRNYLNQIRRDFADKPLEEQSVNDNPFLQFSVWFEEAVNAQLLDPYAMLISTVDEIGLPHSRVVYLRSISDEGMVFYTNYNSQKGKNISASNKIAITFFWVELERQIRIEGTVKKVSEELSDKYFAARPRESQLGAWASNQSETIKNRAELEENLKHFTEKFKGVDVPRPPHWGGYIVEPTKFEFWQGRPSRLHDRLIYTKNNSDWVISRIAP